MIRLQKKNIQKTLLGLGLILFIWFLPNNAISQSLAKSPAKKDAKLDPLKFKERWAFRVNAVDLMLLTPNIGVDFDLTNSQYNKWTIGLNAKYNWDTNNSIKTQRVYNILDGRVELKKYYRTEPLSGPSKVPNHGFFNNIRRRFLSRQCAHPRYWRAYYGGFYAGYTDYSLNFGNSGKQGTAYSLGVLGGFGIPLYGYSHGFLDLEFGASLGLMYTQYDKYRFDEENNRYFLVRNVSGHVVPYPLLTDVRAALVWRFKSVKDKYKFTDHIKEQNQEHERELRKALNDSINTAKEKIRNAQRSKAEALRAEKDRIQKLKDDSIQAIKDSILKKQNKEEYFKILAARKKKMQELEVKQSIEKQAKAKKSRSAALKDEKKRLLKLRKDSIQKAKEIILTQQDQEASRKAIEKDYEKQQKLQAKQQIEEMKRAQEQKDKEAKRKADALKEENEKMMKLRTDSLRAIKDSEDSKDNSVKASNEASRKALEKELKKRQDLRDKEEKERIKKEQELKKEELKEKARKLKEVNEDRIQEVKDSIMMKRKEDAFRKLLEQRNNQRHSKSNNSDGAYYNMKNEEYQYFAQFIKRKERNEA